MSSLAAAGISCPSSPHTFTSLRERKSVATASSAESQEPTSGTSASLAACVTTNERRIQRTSAQLREDVG
jgi:hypothetical protein